MVAVSALVAGLVRVLRPAAGLLVGVFGTALDGLRAAKERPEIAKWLLVVALAGLLAALASSMGV